MKKLVYFFGIFALIAGFVTSCGDDDDDDEGNGNSGVKTVSQKKLKKLVDDNYYWEYTYDKDGRCTSYSEFYQNEPSEKANYKYEGNKIIEECCLLDGEVRSTTTVIINPNGYIESETTENGGASDNTVYTYDNQGHLISKSYSDEESDGTRVTTYTWENGNVSKIEVKDIYEGEESEYVMYYEYTNSNYSSAIDNKAGFNALQIEDDIISPCYFGTVGVSMKNLPVSIKCDDETQTLTWTLDGDGYPVKVTSKLGSDVDSIEFVWE